MLYYSGRIESMGEVDSGDTVTDCMAQERERGITISSASVRFDWRRHRVNLIDTPGHVDFTFEVERCLSVLDAAVGGCSRPSFASLASLNTTGQAGPLIAQFPS